MDDGHLVPFSALLAGALLIKKDISNIELANSICLFEEQMNCYIDDGDLYKLYGVVGRDDDGFHLIKNYDDKFNNICTVKEYLYSMTNPMIRSFFGYPEEIKVDNDKKNITGIFKRIRTRVSH